jgi:PHP family Zn ribbon phosphoesterase
MHRVEELANHPENNFRPYQDEFGVTWMGDPNHVRPPYVSLVPLLEVLSEVVHSGVATDKVLGLFDRLVNHFGSEHEVLFRVPIIDIKNVAGERAAEAIEKVRARNIRIVPGFDGEYGKFQICNQ